MGYAASYRQDSGTYHRFPGSIIDGSGHFYAGYCSNGVAIFLEGINYWQFFYDRKESSAGFL